MRVRASILAWFSLANLAEFCLKLRIEPRIVASGPLVWELRHLQRGHFGAVHGAAGVL